MNRQEKVAVVESYINGLGKGDFSDVPFADNVTYESPLSKKTGREAINFLAGLFPLIQGVEIRQHIVEDDYIATLFHLRTANGVTAVFDRFRVVDGKLREINPYYDPAILTEAIKAL